MTTSVLNEKNQYLAQFEQLERELGDRDPPWLRRLRKAAIARFDQLGFPTARNEDWKFTNVASLAKSPFPLAPKPTTADYKKLHEFLAELPFFLSPYPALGRRAPQGAYCTLLNGACGDCCSSPDMPANFNLWPLWAAVKEPGRCGEPYLGHIANYQDRPLIALNTAFLHEGACVCIPKNVVVQYAIHIAHVSMAAGEPTASHPRCLVVMGENSRATIVETFIGPEGQTYFTNAVTEIVLGDNAVLDHCKLQQESGSAFHIATTAVHQAKGSNFRTHYIGLGGKLVRNEVHVRFDGEGCEATVNGLYLASGNQHMDNFTVIDHAKPHCASHELYKGILDGKAHGVFNGKIFVRPDAQKTDAKQTNQTLLLSEDAVINTKPQLEIFADDVKCTHGATVGQLDPNQLFYLRARGLGRDEARNLLTFAFGNDIIGRIQVEPLRQQLEELLLTRRHLGKE